MASAFVTAAGETAREEDERRQIRQLQVEFALVPGTTGDQFQKDFPAYADGLVCSSPGGYVALPEYPKKAETVYNLKPRADDVYVLTFPKCGTTWMQELVWLVVNDCNFEKAKAPLNIRSPFLEICGHVMRDVEEMEEMTEPRIIKSHLPLYLLNPKLLDTSKVVYVARNPKDVLVSYFHYHRLIHFHQFTGDLESFADYFMSDKVYASPFFPHLLDAWSKRRHPNLLFVFYEDLKQNLRGEIEKVVSFLGKSLTEEQLTRLTQHLHVDQFAKNEAVNYEICKELGFMNNTGNFIRKGKTGDWKNHFSSELNARIDLWIESNLKGSDLTFITELDQQD
ncbi:hypothetical protein DAPPUDRAFT_301389 [Daphnia pulex]|uniref:Sulfotransferase domain-containing protein n=1 Tax=Daphnia pulex TaxID=6669 RepID=E9G969_DAPPU|nr:hypothetical protein DAPPUDRAFT_301389 [Daphnia pulex]|eukprot:EFX84144.1 hypothetical protein DAPPUDRAFT_301389 [Daphnia pulex]